MPARIAQTAATSSADHAQPAISHRHSFIREALAVASGTATTLAIYGYRFGESNQTIYLLDALRQAKPGLLGNDWFTTQTFQYHTVFGKLAAMLMRAGAIEPAFATLYVLLVIFFHIAWLGIVRRVADDDVKARAIYLVSVALYYLSAAGTGLGMYQFLQDSSLLPSNIANVAMLWAFYLWIARRLIASGACFGIAGIFHLNYALVGVIAWVLLCLTIRGHRSQAVVGSILALVPSMINIVLGSSAAIARNGSMPTAEFIDIYVRLRHPHHYDPTTWPIGIWLAFLWSVPFAMMLKPPARTIVGLLLSLQLVALAVAGVWFVNETLVQLSLYRFSIFVQLFGCVGAAMLLVRYIPAWSGPLACAAMIVACMIRGPFFGAFVMPRDDAEYLTLCDWAREHTPQNEIFLVPPGESSFRLRAQRAIVVDYKAVPQLSGELRKWVDRMKRVLWLDDLRQLPRRYPKTLAAIDARYASLSDEQLIAAARAYHARFIVAPHQMRGQNLAFSTAAERYFLYDLGAKEKWDGLGGNPATTSGASRPARPPGDE